MHRDYEYMRYVPKPKADTEMQADLVTKAATVMAIFHHRQRVLEPLWRPWDDMPEDFRAACIASEREVILELAEHGFLFSETPTAAETQS